MNTKFDAIYNEVFSEYFTSQREKKGLSIEDAAKMVGLKYTTYYYYEKGQRGCPISVFKEFCKIYDLDFYATFHFLCETVEMRLPKDER